MTKAKHTMLVPGVARFSNREALLLALQQLGGSASMAQISPLMRQRMKKTKGSDKLSPLLPTVTGLLDRGLVGADLHMHDERSIDEENTVLHLTKSGRAALDVLFPQPASNAPPALPIVRGRYAAPRHDIPAPGCWASARPPVMRAGSLDHLAAPSRGF